MPNLSPNDLGSFWHGRSVACTEERWKEGFATLAHPDLYCDVLLQIPPEKGSSMPEKWFAYLSIAVGEEGEKGEVEVEEDVAHAAFRVIAVRQDGKRHAEISRYGFNASKKKHTDKNAQEQCALDLRKRRLDAWEKAVVYARHLARSMA